MITVIVPARDEPEINTFLSQLHDAMQALGEPYEVLVVTGDRERLHTPITDRRNQKTVKCYGDSLERAILLGFSTAKGDKLVVMDADGSHPPRKIRELADALGTHDLAVGSRFLHDSRFDQPFHRKLVSWLFVKYAQFMGSHLSDPMSGFFAVNKDAIDTVRFKPFKWKTALEIELKSQVNPAELPIHFQKRGVGVSKAKIRIGLKVLWDVFWEKM